MEISCAIGGFRLSEAFTVDAFIRKWKAVELKERSAAQEHFIDLCRVLNEARKRRSSLPRSGFRRASFFAHGATMLAAS
jgi:hypothetical protein